MDVVNELPEVIRSDHNLVNDLAAKYDLRLAHFASHYLPNNWQNRTRSVGIFTQAGRPHRGPDRRADGQAV